MTITVTPTSPQNGDINTPLNAEVIFNIVNDSGIVDLAILDVDVTVDTIVDRAIDNGVFTNGFSGELIDNIGDGTDITVVIIRPILDPNWLQGRNVQIDVSDIVIFSYNFDTKAFKFTVPDPYTEELILTSIPAGYTPQTSGGGTSPTYSVSGMTTFPNGGTSYIRKTTAGIDFNLGVLIDVVVFGTGADTKILQICKGGQGLVSVNVDFITGEIWLTDVIDELSTGFRPGVKIDAPIGSGVQFRLSIEGIKNDLVARLYSGLVNATEPILLKQTAGPSDTIDLITDFISIGSIDTGGSQVVIEEVKILLNEDPDDFYPFPQVDAFLPQNGTIDGGGTLRIQFDDNIDINAGSELFFSDETLRDESSGAGSMSVTQGTLSLNTSGIGTSAVRFMRSYSGDRPSGSDVSVNTFVDTNIIDNLPQNEVILSAFELRAGGDIIAAEYVASVLGGTFFRIMSFSGSIQTLNTKVLQSNKNNFTYRMLRAGTQLIMLIDGTNLITTNFKDGPGIIRLYNKNVDSINNVTNFNNFKVLPVVLIGDNIVV